MREVRIPAFAKVNLRLEILGERPDGYHELRTVFQTVSLHDDLRLRASHKRGILLVIRGNEALAREPLEKNLVYRAVKVLQLELKIHSGVAIELRKNIPAGRGLGGGSSDAAAALLGYLRLVNRKLPLSRLAEIAAGLGADVPFFLFGGRALGIRCGDEVYPLPDRPPRTVLIVSPSNIHVPTADAYRWLRAQPLFPKRLTKPALTPKLWKFCALCWSTQEGGLLNDFESPVFQRHRPLASIKRVLLRQGAADGLLAGSGSGGVCGFSRPGVGRRGALRVPEQQTVFFGSPSPERDLRLIKAARVG